MKKTSLFIALFTALTSLFLQAQSVTALTPTCKTGEVSLRYAGVGQPAQTFCTCDNGRTVETRGTEGYCVKSDSSGRQGGPTGITNPAIDPKLGGNPDAANSGSTFQFYFITIWRALIVVGGLAVLFNLINGAIEWITAGGQQDKVSHARQRMTEAIVGMIILAGSFIIIAYIASIFHLNLLDITIPKP